MKTLDPFHPYGKTKRLRDKPIQTFDDSDLFLRILGAARDGLITYTFGIPHDTFQVSTKTTSPPSLKVSLSVGNTHGVKRTLFCCAVFLRVKC